VRGDAWLCVAHDYKSGERRDFNLARIKEVHPCWPESNGGDYQIPEDFDLELYFIDRFEALAGGEVCKVRLRVEPSAAPYFRSKTYHRTQQIHESDPQVEDDAPGRGLLSGSSQGGSSCGEEDQPIIVSYEVAGLEEIAAFVRSWGTSVTVLDPPELAEHVAAEARAVAAQYEENGQTSS